MDANVVDVKGVSRDWVIADLYSKRGVSQADIGRAFRISRERVRQILTRAGVDTQTIETEKRKRLWRECSCGKLFYGGDKRRKSCSAKCRSKRHHFVYECELCGKPHTVFKSASKRMANRFCSNSCRGAWLSKSLKTKKGKLNYYGRYNPREIVKQYFRLNRVHVVTYKDGNRENRDIKNLLVYKNHSELMKHLTGVEGIKPVWDGSSVRGTNGS
jgi:hypothetical protein